MTGRALRAREPLALLAASIACHLLSASTASAAPDDAARERSAMVATQLAGRDVRDPRVLAAMGTVPRERFVPEALRAYAYADRALPIGAGQTISQPYVVAKMTELLRLQPADRVFELGTGSGYQAAVASRAAARVYSVEIVPALAAQARFLLRELGYDNVQVRTGDGYRGWPEEAPFDAILVTAAVPRIPEELLAQLRPGGRAVLPVGPANATQELVLLEKRPDGHVERTRVFDVRFVPATGVERGRHGGP